MYNHFSFRIVTEVVHLKYPALVERFQIINVDLPRSLCEVPLRYLNSRLRVVVQATHVGELVHRQLAQDVVE